MSGLVIDREVLIEAPAEVVWRTITEPDQITRWFADRVDLVVEPGAHGYMGFGEQGGPVVVEVVDSPTRFSFRWNKLGRGRARGRQLDPGRVHADARGRRADPSSAWWRAGTSRSPGPTRRRSATPDDHQGGWGTFLDRLAALFGKRQPE